MKQENAPLQTKILTGVGGKCLLTFLGKIQSQESHSGLHLNHQDSNSTFTGYTKMLIQGGGKKVIWKKEDAF